MANGVTQPPFDAVAGDCFAERAWNRKPDPGSAGLGLANVKGRKARA